MQAECSTGYRLFPKGEVMTRGCYALLTVNKWRDVAMWPFHFPRNAWELCKPSILLFLYVVYYLLTRASVVLYNWLLQCYQFDGTRSYMVLFTKKYAEKKILCENYACRPQVLQLCWLIYTRCNRLWLLEKIERWKKRVCDGFLIVHSPSDYILFQPLWNLPRNLYFFNFNPPFFTT